MRRIPAEKHDVNKATCDLLREAKGRRRDTEESSEGPPSSCHRNSGGEVPQDQGLPPRSPRPTCKVGTVALAGAQTPHCTAQTPLPRGPVSTQSDFVS